MGNNIFKSNYRSATPEDFGCTEDEFSNFMVDLFRAVNGKRDNKTQTFQYFDAVTGEVVESKEPISVRIKISQ